MIFDFLLKKSPQNCPIKPTVLLILDGWGIAPPSRGNPIYLSHTPFMDQQLNFYPHSELIASGESVGLPANEVGNSEVGHLTIGAGRAVLQSLMHIDLAIKDGSFFTNHAFLQAVNHVRHYHSKLHLLGLISSGKVHSSIDHFWALLELCRKQEISPVMLHLFTDGRDSPPQEALTTFLSLEQKIEAENLGSIVSVSGRYYAMDRDARWDRTQKVYDACVLGKGLTAASASQAIQNSYHRGQTDEFIEPTIIPDQKGQFNSIGDNDAVIFFNFRIDRPRQLSLALVHPDFEHLKVIEWGYQLDQGTTKKNVTKGATFKREKLPQNLCFVTMTDYQKNLPVSAIAFEQKSLPDTLPETLSKHGLRQLHLAESEKERMVSYYLDGMREDRFTLEDLKIVASPKVKTYDQKPEMSVDRIVSEYVKALKSCQYHFFVLNFANPDMVAHTGNIAATKKALEAVDRAVAQLVKQTLNYSGTIFITADHGNAEELLTYPTASFFYTTRKGSLNTDHSNNPVPFWLVSPTSKNKEIVQPHGSLSDIAPTILTHLNLPIPSVMTGRNLLK